MLIYNEVGGKCLFFSSSKQNHVTFPLVFDTINDLLLLESLSFHVSVMCALTRLLFLHNCRNGTIQNFSHLNSLIRIGIAQLFLIACVCHFVWLVVTVTVLNMRVFTLHIFIFHILPTSMRDPADAQKTLISGLIVTKRWGWALPGRRMLKEAEKTHSETERTEGPGPQFRAGLRPRSSEATVTNTERCQAASLRLSPWDRVSTHYCLGPFTCKVVWFFLVISLDL